MKPMKKLVVSTALILMSSLAFAQQSPDLVKCEIYQPDGTKGLVRFDYNLRTRQGTGFYDDLQEGQDVQLFLTGAAQGGGQLQLQVKNMLVSVILQPYERSAVAYDGILGSTSKAKRTPFTCRGSNSIFQPLKKNLDWLILSPVAMRAARSNACAYKSAWAVGAAVIDESAEAGVDFPDNVAIAGIQYDNRRRAIIVWVDSENAYQVTVRPTKKSCIVLKTERVLTP
jgi:hypothetical protein